VTLPVRQAPRKSDRTVCIAAKTTKQLAAKQILLAWSSLVNATGVQPLIAVPAVARMRLILHGQVLVAEGRSATIKKEQALSLTGLTVAVDRRKIPGGRIANYTTTSGLDLLEAKTSAALDAHLIVSVWQWMAGVAFANKVL
jgi:hypothetical protein